MGCYRGSYRPPKAAIALPMGMILGVPVANATSAENLPVQTGEESPSGLDGVPDDNSTPDEVRRIKEAGDRDAVAQSSEVVDGRLMTDYELESDSGLRARVITSEPDPSAVGPQLRAGVGWGVYLYLNRTDQTALTTGGAAGLAVIACSIPAVNVVGCAAVTAALASAAVYINNNGYCANELEIRLTPFASYKCV